MEYFRWTADCLSTLDEIGGSIHRELDDSQRQVADAIAQRLHAGSPSVTVVGQVKAGKTALTNALAGAPGLLPTDVNPLTAVVTSLHLNPPEAQRNRAVFSFFDRAEWQQMMEGAGRVGALARDAGLDREVETLRAQTTALHDKARERLGANFELLLGSAHRFGSITPELIERYVCLGAETEAESPNARQGRFADVTRSADLYLPAPHYGARLTLRDTPGVNDPFLVREQVTLRCLGQSHLCIVVLSAHQALSTADLGLLRLLGALDRSQALIFVNRIDELGDAREQIGEIEERMRQTLQRSNLAADVPIVFGSALWANAALGGTLGNLPAHSIRTLGELGGAGDAAAALAASGLPQLQALMAERLEAGSIGHAVRDAAARYLNLGRQTLARLSRDADAAPGIGAEALFERLNPLVARQQGAIEKIADAAFLSLRRELRLALGRFLRRESEALRIAMRDRGGPRDWKPDASTFRNELNECFFRTLGGFRADLALLLADAAAELSELYGAVLGGGQPAPAVTPPQPPLSTPPVAIATALSVDMTGSWWTGFFSRFRGAEARLQEFQRQLKAETLDILAAVENDHAVEVFAQSRALLAGFLEEHGAALYDLASDDAPAAGEAVRARMGLGHSPELSRERLSRLVAALETLGEARTPAMPAPRRASRETTDNAVPETAS